jgi:hypothetical protein
MAQARIRGILATTLALACLPVGPGADADVLETREGRVLEGVYLGGTEQAVRFRTGDEVEVFLVEEVVSLRFDRPGLAAAPHRTQRTAPPAAAPRPELSVPAPRPTTAAPAPPHATPAPAAPQAAAPAPAASRLFRVPAGTHLRVRLTDGIDARTSAVGDRFGATLETGLGADGVAILPAGTRLYGQVAELRAAGPVASRLKLELTQLMVQGQLLDIVTGSQQQAEAEKPDPANASTIPQRPGVNTGSVLEFRLLQPFDVRLP